MDALGNSRTATIAMTQETQSSSFQPANSTKPAAMALMALTLFLSLTLSLPLASSQLDPPRQYYYQPDNQIYLDILDSYERDVTEIIRQRLQKVWGADATPYLEALTSTPYHGYYQSDSTLSQRRSLWRSSLFAQDLDFIAVSLSTYDGRFSLRETYAINRNDKRWVVIDSAGFPLFERIIEVSSDDLTNPQGQRDFLLTLLSYAGYGSYDILGSPDSVYHGIELAEVMGDDYYPFASEQHGDTTETSFTACLRDGVEVTRWMIKYFGDGLLIDESEQLVTYEDLPQEEDANTDSLAAASDSSVLAGMLSDIPRDSLEGVSDSGNGGREIPQPRPQAPGGDIRLADLLSGTVKPPPVSGHVSYEILSAKLVLAGDSTLIDNIPEFTRFIEPVYPPEALQQRAEGVVEIMLRVDPTGKAKQAMIRKRSDKKVGFELSAKTAGQLSEFRPGIVDGKPADMWLTYRLSFRLAGKRKTNNQSAKPDSTVTDSLTNDTTLADSTNTDTLSIDSTSADSTASDSIAIDSSVIDSSHIDSTAVDSTSSDSATTDATKPAPTPSDSSKTDSSKTATDSTTTGKKEADNPDTTTDTTESK